MKKFAITSLMSSIALLVITTSGITATFAANDKITICHRTDSVTNPYVQITVDPNAADGDTGNDNGQGDHAVEHTGPVPTNQTEAQTFKDNHIEWGDIIPPHDNFPGLNWTTEGQAIYNNGCNYTSVTPTQAPTETPSGSITPSESITPTEETPTPSTSSMPTVTPSPTNPCEGASCNTGGNSPTPTSEVTITPTVTVSETTAPTATPTSAPIGGTAATETPTPTSTSNISGTNTIQPTGVQSTQNTPAEQVLGASAMAATGGFVQILMNIIGALGASLIGLGFLSYRKNATQK